MDKQTNADEPAHKRTKPNPSINETEQLRMASEKDFSTKINMLKNNPYKADITFFFKAENVTMFGHKFLLAISSPVFNAMFQSNWTENQIVTFTDDVPSYAFTEVLNYIYGHVCNLSNLTEDNAFEIMYIAHKYEISTLEEMMCDFLLSIITNKNVCRFFEHSELFGNKLAEQCRELMKRYTLSIMASDTFLSVSIGTLRTILSFDAVGAEEHELFDGMMRWAESACLRAAIPSTRVNMRKVLKGVDSLIRYRTWNLNDFAKCSEKLATLVTAGEHFDIYYAIAYQPNGNNNLSVGSESFIKRSLNWPLKFTWTLDREILELALNTKFHSETISITPNRDVQLEKIYLDDSVCRWKTISVCRCKTRCNSPMFSDGPILDTIIQPQTILLAGIQYYINVYYTNHDNIRPNLRPKVLRPHRPKTIQPNGIKLYWQITQLTTFLKFDFVEIII